VPYTAEDDALLRVIGQNLRKARLAKSWSQEQLSLESGLHRTYVGAVERGERNITVINLRKLAAVLGVKLAVLVKRAD
jgi:transcriptional regulator with XRE-family HTH domain